MDNSKRLRRRKWMKKYAVLAPLLKIVARYRYRYCSVAIAALPVAPLLVAVAEPTLEIRVSSLIPRSPLANPNKRPATSPLLSVQEETGIRDLLLEINANIKSLDTRMSRIEENVDTWKGVVNKRLEKIESVLEHQVKTVEKLQPAQLEENFGQLHNNLDFLREKIDALESYSRKSNLVFKGIQEDTKESWEKTEVKVIAVVKLHMDMEPKSIARAHQVGVKGKGPRPIIVKFESEKEKRGILFNRTKFKGSEVYVDEDYTKEIRQKRYHLFQEAKKCRQAGEKATVITEKDIIILSETWLKEKENKQFSKKLDDLFSWDFLPATRSKKKGRAKGGQLIAVRRSLDWAWTCEKWKYGLVIRYQVEPDRGIPVSVYCNEGITRLAEELDLILAEAEDMGCQVMIMGDFNARTANQQMDLGDTHDVRNSEDDTINEEGRLLLKFMI
uniref:Endonuclease/exonuclease/phosphatase domain-containing protein n=1 Tax=Strigamia maritima TaxID=126957 RepID=T1JAI2_STRMM